jgi:hypothetical protein
VYRQRIDALEAVREQWAEVRSGLTDAEWSRPSRCAGWDVAALFAHVGVFPQAVLDAPRADGGVRRATVHLLDVLDALGRSGRPRRSAVRPRTC